MSENNNFFRKLEWDDRVEKLLSGWADIAACYTWLFDKSYRKNSRIHFSFSLPIIIFSTVTGTLIMSLNSLLPAESVKTGQTVLGAVNIFTGILSTLQNYLNPGKKSETNLQASKGWSKFERNIKIQLALARKNRKNVSEFLRECRKEYENLLDNCPVIDSGTISLFRKSFQGVDIIRPEILDKIEKTVVDKEEVDSQILRKPLEEIREEQLSEKKIKINFDSDEDFELTIHPS